MLKLFEVSNFKNFNKKFSLDFADVKDYKFNTDCIANGLLNTIIIYGKNAVGKSNFGLALFDIVSHLTSKNVTPGLYDYYLNADNTNGLAEFRYVFQFGESELDYRYGKDNDQNLVYEHISLNSKLLMKYNYTSQTGDLDELKRLAPTLNWVFQDEGSILKYVINNTIINNDHPLRQMMWFVSNMLWFRSLDENRYIGYKTKSNDYLDFIFESGILEEFQGLLQQSGIDEKLIVKKDNDGINRLYFDTEISLPFFKVASSGTKALYTYFYWYKTASDVSFMYIDEFDAFYHYELSESIVIMLEKMNKFQKILTSHNTNLLSNRIMRPDCYFILTKDKLTSFANATERDLREGHNLKKLYMSGEFDD